jgi:hypothetical protein
VKPGPLTPEQQLDVPARIWGKDRDGYIFLPWIDGSARSPERRRKGYHEGRAYEWPSERRARCFWQPQTHMVRLTGGHVDGAEYQVRDVWQPFMMPEPVSVGSLFAEDDPLPVVPRVLTYRMSGWSEADRVWIFSS